MKDIDKIKKFYEIQLYRLKEYETAGKINTSARIEAQCLNGTLESLKGFFPELRKSRSDK